MTIGLNAPFGARCFLTLCDERLSSYEFQVLMHLLALGAFCPHNLGIVRSDPFGLNAPFGARCFLSRYGPEPHIG